MSAFQQVKLFLVGHLHLAKDALHIYVALAIFFGAALLLKWPLKDGRLWALVAAAAIAGEAWDLIDSRTYGTPIDLGANAKDIVNTIFWPTVISMLARWTRVMR